MKKHTDDMLKKLLAPLALLAITLTAAGNADAQASAQNFPNKPIHIIVTFSSGGAPDISKRLLGLEPISSTPEELAAYQRSEIVKWAKVVKDSGAKLE